MFHAVSDYGYIMKMPQVLPTEIIDEQKFPDFA